MVEPLDADVADRAVRGARGSVDVAGVAVFYTQQVGLDVHGVHIAHPGQLYHPLAYGDPC